MRKNGNKKRKSGGSRMPKLRPHDTKLLKALSSYSSAKKRGDSVAMKKWREQIDVLRRHVPDEKSIDKGP